MKAKARAHPMQGLVKYHGLRDRILRIPYHDSISVNVEALWTETEVEFGEFADDEFWINGVKASQQELRRCQIVLDKVRQLSGITYRAKVISVNSLTYSESKGLGFSSSGGAALAAAAYSASGLAKERGWDITLISRLARLLAGSACKSAVGGYARWYAGVDDQSSYAVQIGDRSTLDLGMLVVPVQSSIRTDVVHEDVTASPFFEVRVRSAQNRVEEIHRAILEGDLVRVGMLAERDTLELHALIQTGRQGLIVYEPQSLKVIKCVRELRQEGKAVFFSMQTGPSVFVNTYPEDLSYVKSRLLSLGVSVIESVVGGEVRIL
ncbi:MAG: diphosphomevalonate decarboxylase [Nitrososphaerales archaeon]